MLATDLQALDGNFVFMDKRKKTPKRRVKKKCFKSPASSSTRQSLLKSRSRNAGEDARNLQTERTGNFSRLES